MNEKEFLEIAGEVMPHASKKAVKTRKLFFKVFLCGEPR